MIFAHGQKEEPMSDLISRKAILKHIDNNVNHPEHYNQSGIECIDVIIASQGKEAAQDFCICNAMKYIFRHNMRYGIEDVKKAQWYINKYLELME